MKLKIINTKKLIVGLVRQLGCHFLRFGVI